MSERYQYFGERKEWWDAIFRVHTSSGKMEISYILNSRREIKKKRKKNIRKEDKIRSRTWGIVILV